MAHLKPKDNDNAIPGGFEQMKRSAESLSER
ncbi:uncharacterized protein G2W53_036461 [Senna tora]|uniref:Uncharacterized protein n=1 Tax=Senna tora TaxID=362788 RepID=A0A834W624_9FABA|nr:uncharacterized protein G2W53_036461 [Senna tora]